MDSDNRDYHISFFKPTTHSARRNRNMIVQFVLIWAVAIFGFQILIKILEKPVPEESYIIYETYWSDIKGGELDKTGLQEVGKSALSVLGKVAITPDYRLSLDNAVSWMAYNLADSVQKVRLISDVAAFEEIASASVNFDEKYVAARDALVPLLSTLFNIQSSDVRSRIAPLEIKTSMMESFDDESIKVFEEAMDLYLIHNRSVLTDTVFLGFPFHYFYTAVFLLILFVGLCWLYCTRTDQFNLKYGIED